VHFSNANNELVNIKEWTFEIAFNANVQNFPKRNKQRQSIKLFNASINKQKLNKYSMMLKSSVVFSWSK
jgi:hypothetical protein